MSGVFRVLLVCSKKPEVEALLQSLEEHGNRFYFHLARLALFSAGDGDKSSTVSGGNGHKIQKQLLVNFKLKVLVTENTRKLLTKNTRKF